MYDLPERTYRVAKNIREWIKKIPKTISNIEDLKQLSRSSGSVAANCIETDEALSKQDFRYRAKLCRKEAKETILWLQLVTIEPNLEKERNVFIDEYLQLKKIFSAIVNSSK